MTEFWKQLEMVFYNVLHEPRWYDLLDILIIAVLIYFLTRFANNTRTIQVVKGLGILVAVNYISSLIGFTALSWVLQTILNNGVVLLIVIFQPEFRRVLEQLGRGAHVERREEDRSEEERIVQEITACLLRLSRRRVGALIVFEQNTGLKDVTETGVALNARISGALLENIFEPNTPLHDGAVIICGTEVCSAACVLALSESNSLSQDLGTRHRAALGISEQTDARVLIVSEETGIISMAKNGRLSRHLDEDALKRILNEMYVSKKFSLKTRLQGFLKSLKKGEPV